MMESPGRKARGFFQGRSSGTLEPSRTRSTPSQGRAARESNERRLMFKRNLEKTDKESSIITFGDPSRHLRDEGDALVAFRLPD
jgi:hypothetical protein